MKMYQITRDGESLFLKPEELTDAVISDYLDKGESYELRIVDMSSKEVANLSEFEGF